MARPKEFDPGEAMREAMEAFWERGYHATSVSDLLTEMKLNRGSLYDTFGDKKSLFLSALTEYERQGRERFVQAFDRPGSAKVLIREWVMAAARTCTGERGLRGCLALKAAMEMAPHDKDVADWCKRVTLERERMLGDVVRRGQRENEIDPQLDPPAVARYLMSSLNGLRVLGMASPTERAVDEVVSLILRVLE